ATQWCGVLLKTGPNAKPSAGSVKAPAAIAPAVWALPVMKRRRVIVSPSKAPGIKRSAVYLDVYLVRLSATAFEQYRGVDQLAAASSRALVRIASRAPGAPSRTSCLALRWGSLAPQPTA